MLWQVRRGLISGRGALDAVASVATTTLNPSDKSANIDLSNGDLTATHITPFVGYSSVRSIGSFTTSQKVFFEVHIDANASDSCCIGFMNAADSVGTYAGAGTGGVSIVVSSGLILIAGTVGSSVASAVAGDYVQCAVDGPNSAVYWRTVHSGTPGNWNNDPSANPLTNTGGISTTGLAAGPYFAALTLQNSGVSDVLTANFGATGYAATQPSGFGNL